MFFLKFVPFCPFLPNLSVLFFLISKMCFITDCPVDTEYSYIPVIYIEKYAFILLSPTFGKALANMC